MPFADTSLQSLPARDIDTSSPSLFWAREPSEALMRSIALQGQLEPVLADLAASRPLLLAGHSRVAALARLEREVLVRSVTASEAERGLIYLASNAGRETDDAMRLRALRHFHGLTETGLLPASRVEEEVLPLLGLTTGSRQARSLALWTRLPETLQEHALAGRAPLDLAAHLAAAPAEFDPDDLAALEPLFRELAWSRSSVRNLVLWLGEIARRDGISPGSAVDSLGLDDAAASGLSPKDALARILDAVRTARFPVLRELERGFESRARDLTAGTPWKAAPAQSFETGAVTISATVSSPQDLSRALSGLERMAASPAWRRLWSLGEEEAEDASLGETNVDSGTRSDTDSGGEHA